MTDIPKMFFDDDMYIGDYNNSRSFNLMVDKKEEDMALEGYEEGDTATVKFVPSKEISYKYDTGYGVYHSEMITSKEDELPDTFKINGSFITPLDIGQSYEATGEVTIYRGKKQLKIKTIKKITPTNKRGIISFLKTLKGLGSLAEIIYDEFEEKSLDVIRNNPKDLLSLSPSLYEELVLDWKKQLEEIKDDQGILAVLMGYGIKSYQAKKLYDEYKELVVAKIRENPYILSKEIKGYSFTNCDKVAQKIGFDPKSPLRINEAIMFVLNEAQYNGHTYLPKDILIERAKEVLAVKMNVTEMKKAYEENSSKDIFIYKYGHLSYKVEVSKILDALVDYDNAKNKKEKESAKLIVVDFENKDIEDEFRSLELENRIVIDAEKIYLKDFYESEMQVAHCISQIMKSEKKIEKGNIELILDKYLSKNGIELKEKQREAVLTVASSFGGFTIIDGSAGSGKTFCLKIALKLIEFIYKRYNNYFESMILAPTGKASRVVAKATKQDAFTVHRALKYNPLNGYYFNATNKLPIDCLVLDESSMLDIDIARHLLEAIPPTTKVIFLGDTKQLPSVGAGNVLKDLIDSKNVNVVTLNVVKRQGEDSGIIKNASRIIDGEMIEDEPETNDAYLLNVRDAEEAHDKLFQTVELLKKTFSFNEIQVLSPQRDGLIGTNFLNFLLQEKFNPENNEIRFKNKEISVTLPNDYKTTKFDLFFKKGDKVIHTKNNYTIDWYMLNGKKLLINPDGCGVTNGECGRIIKLIEGKDEFGNIVRKIVVKYEDKYVIYENDFSELDHSYALTIHKSQGSEWDAVIIMMMFSSYNMLDNNLFYTGYTRAKSFVATIGEQNAIKHAVKTKKSIVRYTGLADRIQELLD